MELVPAIVAAVAIVLGIWVLYATTGVLLTILGIILIVAGAVALVRQVMGRRHRV